MPGITSRFSTSTTRILSGRTDLSALALLCDLLLAKLFSFPYAVTTTRGTKDYSYIWRILAVEDHPQKTGHTILEDFALVMAVIAAYGRCGS